jgi:hypothetical protein
MNAKYSWFRFLLISLFSFAIVPHIFGASTYLSDSIGSTSNTGFVFVTNNTQRMVIDTYGNLGLGMNPDVDGLARSAYISWSLIIGVGSPYSISNRLNVNGDSYLSGSLTVLWKLFVDTIVNRTVANITVSWGLIPDTAAPLSVRELGTNTTRWNNLYLSGQVTIGWGSPWLNKVLVSDANGLATWTSTSSLISPSNGWSLSGNAIWVNDFIGSTNAQDVVFKSNSITGMVLNDLWYLGVWPESAIDAPLEVYDENSLPLLHFWTRSSGFPWTPMWDSVALGQWAMMAFTWAGAYSIGIWFRSLNNVTEGFGNIAIGWDTLMNTEWDNNIGMGNSALAFSTTWSDNVAVGHLALYANGTWMSNVAIGSYALQVSEWASYNTAVWNYAMYSSTSWSRNVAVGSGAGYNITTWSDNIAIGNSAFVPSATSSNQLNIGNWIYGTGGNIGIGQSGAINDKLVVVGTWSFQGLKILSGASNGYVLTSDASGNASWAAAGGSSTLIGLSLEMR